MQIIVGALVMGSTMFLLVVLFMPRQGAQPPMPNRPGLPLIFGVGLAVGAAALTARAIVPSTMDKIRRRQIAREAVAARDASANPPAQGAELLVGAYQSRTIVAAALLEGTAFLFLVSYMLEGFWPSVVLAILFIAGIAAHIPTAARVTAWLELQSQLIREDQGLA